MEVLLLKEFGVCINEPEKLKYLNQVGIGSSLYTEFGKDGFLCTSKMFLLLNFQQIKDLKA